MCSPGCGLPGRGAALAALSAAIISIAMTRAAQASGPARERCNQFIAALRDGKYDDAEKRFDPTVAALMSTEQLKATIEGEFAGRGKIVKWELSQDVDRGPYEVIVARLEFEHGDPIGLQLAVTTASNLISGLYFVPPPPASAPEIGGAPPAAGSTTANSATADQRCDQVLSDLRDRKFADVIAIVDATGKTMLSAQQLGSAWDSLTGQLGTLTGWQVVQSATDAGLQARVFKLSFQRGAMQVTIEVNPAGEVHTLLFHPTGGGAAATSPPYANPTAFSSRNVEVGAAPNLCNGILTTPTAAGAPFPAAVLFSGSGPNDKDESVGANHPFKDIAEGLSSRGIVVLRFDKRTHLHKSIDPAHFTVEQEYLEDGVAAFALLRAQPDVDRERLFVIGHSEGAVLAPEIAKRAGGIAGVVMLAPSGAPLQDVMLRQARYLGASPEQIAQIEKVRQVVNLGNLPPGQMLQLLTSRVPAGYLADLNRRDEIAIARQIGVPILVLRGERDYQVVDEDIAAWRAGLKGTPNVTFREFPGLNHLFIAGTGKPGPAEYSTPGHVAVEVVAAIANFIKPRAPKADGTSSQR